MKKLITIAAIAAALTTTASATVQNGDFVKECERDTVFDSKTNAGNKVIGFKCVSGDNEGNEFNIAYSFDASQPMDNCWYEYAANKKLYKFWRHNDDLTRTVEDIYGMTLSKRKQPNWEFVCGQAYHAVMNHIKEEN